MLVPGRKEKILERIGGLVECDWKIVNPFGKKNT
jgi:hypothetical protein